MTPGQRAKKKTVAKNTANLLQVIPSQVGGGKGAQNLRIYPPSRLLFLISPQIAVESSSRRVFRRQYQEGYGWEAAALCDSSQLIGRVLVPGFP